MHKYMHGCQAGSEWIDVRDAVTVQMNSDLVAVKSGVEALDSDLRKATSDMVRLISRAPSCS